jgi:hypothetical protein
MKDLTNWVGTPRCTLFGNISPPRGAIRTAMATRCRRRSSPDEKCERWARTVVAMNARILSYIACRHQMLFDVVRRHCKLFDVVRRRKYLSFVVALSTCPTTAPGVDEGGAARTGISTAMKKKKSTSRASFSPLASRQGMRREEPQPIEYCHDIHPCDMGRGLG